MAKAKTANKVVDEAVVEDITQSEYSLVISGGPLQITDPAHPDKSGNSEWWMKQPDDWLYDMAESVREVAKAQALSDPDIAAGKELPPSDTWIANQKEVIARRTREIAELKERIAKSDKEGGTEEQRIELSALEFNLKNLYNPDEFTRADEVANAFATRTYEAWLIRRLVTDKEGRLLFDPKTEEGDRAWQSLGRQMRSDLRAPLYQVLMLVQMAKNWQGGQRSD